MDILSILFIAMFIFPISMVITILIIGLILKGYIKKKMQPKKQLPDVEVTAHNICDVLKKQNEYK